MISKVSLHENDVKIENLGNFATEVFKFCITKLKLKSIFQLKNSLKLFALYCLLPKKATFVTETITLNMERKKINRLKVVLADKGMTNKQLAEILGKDPAVVSKWVTNTTQPNVEMFIHLSKILGVSINDLLRTE